jgi:hypothetical protein
LSTSHAPRLEDVFKLSGLPTYTFVEPEEYGRLQVALRTPGRGVVIEGPSGIGKTTAVTKALADLPNGDSVLKLNARRREDREIVQALPEIGSGLIVIDDFHRLGDETKSSIADYLKLLADEEDADVKIIIIGINRAGESLINLAGDLLGRIDVIRFTPNTVERLQRLVNEGGEALNLTLPAAEIAKRSTGSFHVAQLLCHSACLYAGMEARQIQRAEIPKEFVPNVIERVMDDLAMRYMEIAMTFATGPRLSREGRAPYLHILRWLSEQVEWTLSLDRELLKHAELRSSVAALLSGGHISDYLEKNPEVGDLIHFDERTHILAVEDPKFFFFIKNLTWGKFADRVGFLKLGFTTRYDFALSFAGADRPYAKLIFDALVDREFAVFYDANEQSRIMAADLEEYLAPIYKSEATFVICLLGKDYPQRVWTRFESNQFKSRFGAESVIPVGFVGSEPGIFDETWKIGGFYFRPDKPIADQAEFLADLLQKKLADYRLQPKVGSGEFWCRHCFLIHPINQLAVGRVGMCVNCAERYKVV